MAAPKKNDSRDDAGSAGGPPRRTVKLPGIPELDAGIFVALHDLSPDIIYVFEPDGKITYINPAVVKILGRTMAHYIGRSLAEFTHPDDVKPAFEMVSSLISGRNAPPMELRAIAEDGSTVLLEINARPVFGSGGVKYLVGTARDITERRRNEEFFRKSEAFHRSITDNAAEAIFCVGTDGNIKLWNKAARAVFGYTAEEVLGKPVGMLMTPESAQRHEAEMAGFMSSGGMAGFTFMLERTAKRKDGTVFPAEFSITSWTVKEETNYSCVLRDMTDTRKAKLELKKSEEKYRFLFEEMMACNIILGRDGTLLDINRSFMERLGWSKENFIGKPAHDLVVSEERETVRVNLEGILDAPGGDGVDCTIRDSAGRRHTLYLLPGRITVGLQDGREGVLITGVDMTAQRATEAALRESESRYRDLVEHSPLAIFSSDREGSITFVNEALLEMLGSPSAEATKSINVLKFPPLREAGASEIFQRCMDEGKPQVEEKPYHSKWGKDAYARIHAVPVTDQDGNVTGMQAILEDFTERKRKDDALRESEKKYRALAEASPDFIFIIGRDGIVRYVNSHGAVEFGMNPDQIVGTDVSRIFHSDESSEKQNNVMSVFRTGKPAFLESWMTFPNRKIYLNTWLVPLMDDGGAVESVLGISRYLTQRKIAEEDLRDRTAELMSVFKALPDLYFKFASDGTILDYKAGRSEDLYLPPERFMGERIATLMPPDIVELYDSALKKARSTGEASTFEYSLPVGGRLQHYEARIMLLEGTGDQFISFIRNITAQKDAATAFIEQERYRALNDRSLDCVFLLDLEGMFLDVNAAMSELLGYSPGEMLARSFQSLLKEDQRGMARESLKEILQTGTQKSLITYRLRCRDGAIVHLETIGSAVMSGERVTAIQGVARNVTPRVLALEALTESELRYQENSIRLVNIIDSSPDAIIMTDTEGRILEANTASLELTGVRSILELQDRNWFELLHAGDGERARADSLQMLADGRARRGEFLIGHPARGTYPVEISSSVLKALDGTPDGMIFVARDISEQKKMQEQLIQNGKMAAVGTLIAGLSHELNNPLGVIIGYAQSLIKRTPDDSPLMQAHTAIEREARRCSNLVRDLLGFSRKSDTAHARLQAGELISRVAEAARHAAENAGVRLISGTEGAPPEILAPPTEIESVFINLVMNAIQASNAGGSVNISAAPGGNGGRKGVLFSVKDAGTGIPPDVLPRIFEPFFTTKPTGQGTGLGLPLARHIIESVGGEITVRTEAGAGTTMSIWLPAAPEVLRTV